jgi:hypothetical protein
VYNVKVKSKEELNMKVEGNVASKRKDGRGIKVGDDWFSVFNSTDLDHVAWKDDVSFEYIQKGDFKNIKGRVTVTSAGGTSSTGTKKATGYSQVGVQMGHAYNNAMALVLGCKDTTNDMDEVMAAVVEKTVEIYKTTERLRKLADDGAFDAEEEL